MQMSSTWGNTPRQNAFGTWTWRCAHWAATSALVAAFSWPLAVLAKEPAGKPQLDLPRAQLNAGMHLIDAQVALSPLQRQIGLMHRREMAPNEGMLFVFEQPAVQCFWMKNTLLPLTAAFVEDDGRIVNLAHMTPLSEESHCSEKPVRYVLEMHQGWFEKRGIKPGSLLGGLRSPLR